MSEHRIWQISERSEARRFGNIAVVDYEKDAAAKSSLTMEVLTTYQRAVENPNLSPEIAELIKNSPLEFKKILAVIVEANRDLSKQLNFTPAIISLYDPILVGKDRRIATISPLPGRNSRIKLDTSLKRFYGESLCNGGLAAAIARKELRKIMGHEYHHLKLRRQFVGASAKTEAANQPGKTDEYENDRGEKAADLYGSSYSSYKAWKETYPDRFIN